MIYEIWGVLLLTPGKVWEIQDQFTNFQVALDSLADYRLAYGPQWEFEIRSRDNDTG
jgi:hypothetical protein